MSTYEAFPSRARVSEPLRPYLSPTRRGLRVTNSNGGFCRQFRAALLEAHCGHCAYCGEFLCPHSFHVDHLIPKELGGSNSIGNLVASCPPCNTAKGARDLESLREVLAVRFSKYRGVITAAQSRKLAELGVDLGLERFRFFFEEVLEAGA